MMTRFKVFIGTGDDPFQVIGFVTGIFNTPEEALDVAIKEYGGHPMVEETDESWTLQ